MMTKTLIIVFFDNDTSAFFIGGIDMKMVNQKRNRLISLSLMLTLIITASFIGHISFADNTLLPWYTKGVSEAFEWGILPIGYEKQSLQLPITRGEFAEAIVYAYVRASGEMPITWKHDVFIDDTNDFANLAYDLGFVSGYPNGSFKPYGTIKREEMFVMIQKLILKIQNDTSLKPSVIQEINAQFSDADLLSVWAQEASALLVNRTIITGTTSNKLEPKLATSRAEAFIILKNSVKTIAVEPNMSQASTQTIESIVKLGNSDTSIKLPVTTKENGINFDQYVNENQTVEIVSRGGKREEMVTPAELMTRLGNNAVKYASIFGSADAVRYQTAEEAKKHLVSVTVDVWVLGNNGMKTPGKRSVLVNEGIANTVIQIFKEIYNGTERFPIKDLGGYAWRSSVTSEHRWGLAIDINASENYMIRSDGSVVSGSFWKPGGSPYSILPIGDVVNTFKKYGFSWGGDAWTMSNDYMHFSFLGW